MSAKFLVFISAIILLASCNKDEAVDLSAYDCNIVYADSSALHPKAVDFQTFVEEKVSEGFPGMIMLVKDSAGLWAGSGGIAGMR